jgi:hypothetical protein
MAAVDDQWRVSSTRPRETLQFETRGEILTPVLHRPVEPATQGGCSLRSFVGSCLERHLHSSIGYC